MSAEYVICDAYVFPVSTNQFYKKYMQMLVDLQKVNMFLESLVFILLFAISQARADLCKTPKNETGECVLLRECPALRELIATKTDAARDFVRQSICDFTDLDSLVCCASSSVSNSSGKQNEQITSKRLLLPDRKYCGYQHSDDYHHDTSSTSINEFPWLARIAYWEKSGSEDSYQKNYLCLGSLINNKYVLTAATCVVPRRYVVITEIRLGEYHIGNDTDCVSEDVVEECSEPVRDYSVNKIIVHPEYNNRTYINDIALIRLNDTVTYSEYIRPVCLPFPGTKFASSGDTLIISGWGFKNKQLDMAVIKKRVFAQIVPTEECAEEYRKLSGLRIKINDNFLCTRTSENSTEQSCMGDAGAPVIFSHRLQWHQEGIQSFGRHPCGTKTPDVHTRVKNFLDWIEENIEP